MSLTGLTPKCQQGCLPSRGFGEPTSLSSLASRDCLHPLACGPSSESIISTSPPYMLILLPPSCKTKPLITLSIPGNAGYPPHLKTLNFITSTLSPFALYGNVFTGLRIQRWALCRGRGYYLVNNNEENERVAQPRRDLRTQKCQRRLACVPCPSL